MSNNNLSDEVSSLIGVTKARQYEVTKRDIRRFAQAIGEKDPSYSCPDNETDNTLIAPPLFCQTFMYEDLPTELLPRDGSPAELNVPIPAKRTVGGASEFEIHERVRAGDTITATSKLIDVNTKTGRSGLLYFVLIETEFTNQLNKLVAKEVATYIKRM